ASLRVSGEARRLAGEILFPPVALTLRLVAWCMRIATVGLLPEHIRAEYGLTWSPGHEQAFRALGLAVRTVHPAMPGVVRRWPHARIADRRSSQSAGSSRGWSRPNR